MSHFWSSVCQKKHLTKKKKKIQHSFRIETVNKLEIDRNLLNWPDKGHLKNLRLTSHLMVKDWTAYLLASEIRQGYLYLKHFPGGLEGNVPACNAGDLGSIPGLGRSLGEGNGNPLQYCCLVNPMDGGAWSATVHEVTKSQTRLSNDTYTPIKKKKDDKDVYYWAYSRIYQNFWSGQLSKKN